MGRANSGFYTKRLGGNNRITSESIYLGATKGRGSITRRFLQNKKNLHSFTKRSFNQYTMGRGLTRRNYF